MESLIDTARPTVWSMYVSTIKRGLLMLTQLKQYTPSLPVCTWTISKEWTAACCAHHHHWLQSAIQ